MDEIRFEISERLDILEEPVEEAVIFVNGRNLIDLVQEIELPFATRDRQPELAGSYVGLPPEDVFLPSRRLFGKPSGRYDNDFYGGKLAVFGCGCGEVGCWPLRVRITVRDDAVIWSDFEQPHRRAWRHDGLGPFVFDRPRYLAALRR